MTRKTILLSMLLVLAASTAFAQCPSDPSTVLAGRWTFQGGPNGLTGQLIFGVGSKLFTATIATVQNGTLETDDNAAGSYLLNDTCTGGLIFINLARGSVQWNFDIVANANFGRVLNFTALATRINAGNIVTTSVGTAWPAPPGCPAGLANPVNLLSGTYSALSLNSVTVSGNFGSSLRGSMDILAPAAFLGDMRGNLVARLTPSYGTPPTTSGPATQLLPITSPNGDAGTYSVQPDCEKVNLIINFAWPGPIFYVGYPRLRTSGAIDFSVVGGSAFGDPLTSTGTIAR